MSRKHCSAGQILLILRQLVRDLCWITGESVADVSFSTLLRRLRTEAGLTIDELAEASGVSVRGISDLERGRRAAPQRRTVMALAEGLALENTQRTVLLATALGGRERRNPTPGHEPAGLRAFPRAIEDFVGRETELDRLSALADPSRPGSVWPVVVAVSGVPGTGKTALAVHAVRQIADRFPDGQVLVDAQGLDDDPPEPAELMARILKAFGVADQEVANAGLDGRPALYQQMLCGMQCLLVLDNARDEAQIRPLLPASGRAMIVVTSRRMLAGLECARRLLLGELSQQEAAGLLTMLIGQERVEAEPEAVADIAARCGHLPLALRVAGNWLATRTTWTVRRMADRLAMEERRLDALAAGDVRVSAAFDLSYRQLPPEPTRMFRRLATIGGTDVGAACAARLTGQTLPDAEDTLRELVEAGLLSVDHDRYRLHDLLRLFAAGRLREEESAQDADSARADMHRWLLETAIVAGLWYEPGCAGPPPHWHATVDLSTPEKAREWLQAEGTNWLAAFRATAAAGEHAKVVEVAQSLHWFSYQWIFWRHWPEIFRTAAASAQALGDPLLEAHLNYHSWALAAFEGRLRGSAELPSDLA
ncbi:helix-turn-helix domain-containing protein [Streptomyces sp. NPDC013178]|uniref:helix-turn-helix domain-containing protein n=1 Tax=Streptomyces sp. NPDC013178 TaxID=3155118 RepID=UPI0033E003CC